MSQEPNKQNLNNDDLFAPEQPLLKVDLKQQKKDAKAAKRQAKNKDKKPLSDRDIENIAYARGKKEFQKVVEQAKQNYKTAIQKNKTLKQEFINTKSTFATEQEYKEAYEINKDTREAVLSNIKDEYDNIKKEYSKKYKTTGFMMQRWFYGMGKEFNRITWLDSQGILKNFIIVAITMLITATMFYCLDLLISLIVG